MLQTSSMQIKKKENENHAFLSEVTRLKKNVFCHMMMSQGMKKKIRERKETQLVYHVLLCFLTQMSWATHVE